MDLSDWIYIVESTTQYGSERMILPEKYTKRRKQNFWKLAADIIWIIYRLYY